MRTIRLKRRGNARLTAAGLSLSLGLILGAGQVIDSRAAAREASATELDTVVEPADHHAVEETPGAKRGVHFKGHPRTGRTYQL